MLADATRLQLLWALLDGELAVSEFAEAVGRPAVAVSQHLAKLRMARLARTRRQGTHVFYCLDSAHVRQVVEDTIYHAENVGNAPGHHRSATPSIATKLTGTSTPMATDMRTAPRQGSRGGWLRCSVLTPRPGGHDRLRSGGVLRRDPGDQDRLGRTHLRRPACTHRRLRQLGGPGRGLGVMAGFPLGGPDRRATHHRGDPRHPQGRCRPDLPPADGRGRTRVRRRGRGRAPDGRRC